MFFRDLIRWYGNPWVIGGAILVALFLTLVTISIFWLSQPGNSNQQLPTDVFSVIDLPTATTISVSPTPPLNQAPTATLPPAPQPGEISVGAYVQITGTGNDGLRLRFEPGLNNQIRLLGAESEIFQVQRGPQEADSYQWWYLVGPYDETRHGWAVSNFLNVIQNP